MPLQSTLDLMNRLADLVEKNEPALAMTDSACPVSEFSSETQYRREVDALFRNTPIIVGHVSQLFAPGDFITHMHSGVPILVTRNKSGEVAAFLNVCRHRGAIVETQGEGTGKKAFRCPYHAWTYDLDGKLAALPGKESFPSCSADTHSLVPLPVAICRGLVFVQPAPGVRLDLKSFLGALDEHFADFGTERFHYYRTDEIAAPFNWKIAIDGGLETYHLPTVHPASLSALYLSRQTCFEAFGKHGRIAIPKRTIGEIRSLETRHWNIFDQVLLSYFIFPNTILLIANDHMIRFSVFPQAADRTLVLNSTYVAEPAGQRAREQHWKNCADFSRRIVSEDFAVNETMQRALGSQANHAYTFGKVEPALAHFHDGINEALDSAPNIGKTR